MEKGLKLSSTLCQRNALSLQIYEIVQLRILRHQKLERVVV